MWIVYLPVLAASVVLMVPTILVAEKGGRMKEVFVAAIILFAASLAALIAAPGRSAVLVGALVAFFTAFNVMEAMLPSLVTKAAPADAKGTATGLYSSAQFLGIFVGGALGGWASAVAGTGGVFAVALVLALIWLAAAASMRRPGHYVSRIARLGRTQEGDLGALAAQLRAVPGVVEAVIAPEEGVAYLKVDRAQFDAAAVSRITEGLTSPPGPIAVTR
ncbi:MAG: MFS transporter, partial [Stellaceae bacterium]